MNQYRTSQHKQNICLDKERRQVNKNGTLRYSKKIKCYECCHRSGDQEIGTKSVYNAIPRGLELKSVVKNKNACLRYSKLHRKPSLDAKTRIIQHMSELQRSSKSEERTICMKNKNATLRYSCKKMRSHQEQDLLCSGNEIVSTKSTNEGLSGSLDHTIDRAIQRKSSLNENAGRNDTVIQYGSNHDKKEQRVDRNENQSILSTTIAHRNFDLNNHKQNRKELSLLGNENGLISGSGKEQENTDTQTKTLLQGGSISMTAEQKSFTEDCTSEIGTRPELRTVSLKREIVKMKTDYMHIEVPQNANTQDLCREIPNKTCVSNKHLNVREKQGLSEKDTEQNDCLSNCKYSLSKTKDAAKDYATDNRQITYTKYLLVVFARFTVEKLRQCLQDVYSSLSIEKEYFCEDDRKGLRLRVLHENPLYPV